MATKVKIVTGGQARTTNPIAVLNGQEVQPSFDKLGRALSIPYQVRDLISTGSANLTRVAETTIISGVAAAFLDLIYVSGSNTSSIAIRVDLRYGTAGSLIDSLVIPATDVREKQYRVPVPMSEVAQAVTAQVNQSGEISDSPITITMIAVQNI